MSNEKTTKWQNEEELKFKKIKEPFDACDVVIEIS